jgi:hypothetical protein
VARILARHDQGESVAELGRGFGMTPAEVRDVIGATPSVESGR